MHIPEPFDLDSATVNAVNQARRALGLGVTSGMSREVMGPVVTLAVPILQAILEAEQRRQELAVEAADVNERAAVQLQESYYVTREGALTLWPDPDTRY